MQFIGSLFLGCIGEYDILGNDVIYINAPPPSPSFSASVIPGSKVLDIFTRSLGYFADRCVRSRVFQVVTLAPVHIFLGAMTTGITARALRGMRHRVRICTSACSYNVTSGSEVPPSAKKDSVIGAVGSIADVIFSGCLLTAGAALREFSRPIGVTVRGGAILWIAGNLFAAYVDAASKSNDGFGKIAQHGKGHLFVASTALVASVFAAYKMA